MKKGLKRCVSTILATSMLLSGVAVADINSVNVSPVSMVSTVYAQNQINITKAEGWMESAWVEWTPSDTTGVSYYTVAYSNGSGYTQIDDELVRLYKDGHWRADLVGLKAGSYTIKVEAFDSNNSSVASETASVEVSSHDRTGFTFSPKATYYSSADPLQCGGYNGDGTPKSGAEILYITSADDIDNITDSTGTKGLSTILQGRNKRTTTPLIIRIVGKIDYDGDELNSSGYIQVKPSKAYTDYSTTIEGIGSDATINFGILLRNAGNVEVRNLAIHDFKDDGISLDTDNCNIWIHNNEFFYGVQGSGDKAKGDGSSDIKNDSQYVTLSYNHYWDAGKCSLCGMTSESGDNYITYHHNWFDHSDSRHPRIRTMFVHVYNNFYDGNSKYGVGAAKASSAFVEGNYFRNCKHPMLTSLQGSDIMENEKTGAPDFSGDGTFSGENGGVIKAYNNYIVGSDSNELAGGSEPIYYNADDTTTNGAATQFDAYLASSRDELVPSTVKALVGGKTFDNSNVDSYVLSIDVQEPVDAKNTVEVYAGRIGGGDFAAATGFEFTDSTDDTSYDINTTLRTALTNYCKDSISSNFVISSIGGSVDGSFVPVITDSTTTTESTTETTTNSTTTDSTTTTESTTTESTTETTTTTTESTTIANAKEVELGEAVTGFESDSASDTGSDVSITYDSATDVWTLTDTSTSAAATLSIPFASITSGKVLVTGTATPSTSASKWAFVQLRGTREDGITTGEIISIASDTEKKLSVRTYDSDAELVYTSFGEALANASYEYSILVDLDTATADVTINGVTKSVSLNVSAIDSFYSVTSKSGKRNVSIAGLKVYTVGDDVQEESFLYGDASADGNIDAGDSAMILQKVLKSSYATNLEGVTENALKYLDVTADGEITAADAAMVLQKVLNSAFVMKVEEQ